MSGTIVSDFRPSALPDVQARNLELGMQELEALEAPGFWSGFKTGVIISTAGVASYAASVAVVST